MAPKSLIVFCDGTGMDGLLVGDSAADSGSHAGQPLYATNVLRLCRAVLPTKANGQPQIVFYQSGVGSLSDFSGDGPIWDFLLQAYGNTIASKIRDAYAFIAQNYADGDEICIFGFSRGAYTARKVAGLISRIGLLSRENMVNFFGYWLDLVKGTSPGPPTPAVPVPIQCVGVWDTVGSIFEGGSPLDPTPIIDALNIKDQSLPPNINVALHAISLQENRKKFMCTLWSVDQGQTPPPGQVLKQQFFPGAHCNVGGGYDDHELSDLALFWMVGEVTPFIDLDLNYLQSLRQPNPLAWGTAQPNNGYEESSSIDKKFFEEETRLAGGVIQSSSILHSSIQVAPTQLVNHPEDMITLLNLQTAFGATWVPPYAALNPFEEQCKANWSNPLPAKPKGHPIETPEHFTYHLGAL